MRIFNICLAVLLPISLVFLFGCSKPEQATAQEQTVGQYKVILQPTTPLKAGENRLNLSVEPLGGSLPEDLKVSVKTVMPEMPKMAVPDPIVIKENEIHYSVKTDFAMGGEWAITVNLNSGTDAQTAEFHVRVED